MAVGSLELKAFLVETPFFGGLSESSLDLLISMLVERHFELGSTVVAEGNQGAQCLLFAPESFQCASSVIWGV
jgi:CRP/FNR family cyclic AMP-dependent transcriptional regulator